MEKALQDCCRSMRIGKILIDSDSDTDTAHVVFAKFMEDIADRKVDESWKILSHKRKPKSEIALTIMFKMVLLLYPIVSSGNQSLKF